MDCSSISSVSMNTTYAGALPKLRKLFASVQKKTDTKEHMVLKLREIYDEEDYEDFKYAFLVNLQLILKVPRSIIDTSFKYMLDFCVDFLMSLPSLQSQPPSPSSLTNESMLDTLNPLLNDVFEFILKYHNVTVDDIRYGIAVLTRKIFLAFGPEFELSGDLCEQVQEAFLFRLRDRKSFIRIEAIRILSRLQCLQDPDDPVTKDLLLCLDDANSKIRAEALKNIALSQYTFKEVMEHLRDETAECRMSVYEQIKMSTSPKTIRIAYRSRILMYGLTDSDPKIVDYVSQKILMTWLATYDNNFLGFFKALKLDASLDDLRNFEKLLTRIMDVFFRNFTMGELIQSLSLNATSKTIVFEHLTIENVIFWMLLAQKLHENDTYDEKLANLLPELLDFANYVEKFVKNYLNNESDQSIVDILRYEFIFAKLVSMFLYYSLEDVIQKNRVKELLRRFLIDLRLNTDSITILERVLHRLIPRNIPFISEIMSINYSVRYCKERVPDVTPEQLRQQELKRADMIFRVNMLKADLDVAVSEQNFIQAAALKNEIDVLNRELSVKSSINGSISESRHGQEPGTTGDSRVNDDDVDDDDDDDVEDDADERATETDDVIVFVKYYDIMIVCLQIVRPKGDNEPIDNELKTFRKKIFIDMIRFKSCMPLLVKVLECFGMTLLFSNEMARKSLPFLLLPISNYSLPMVDIAYMKTTIYRIIDLILLFKVNVFDSQYNVVSTVLTQACHTPNTSMTTAATTTSQIDDEIMNVKQFVDRLKNLLDHCDDELQIAGIESITRLLATGRIHSGALLALLIIKWFNPNDTDDSKQRQLISLLLMSLNLVPDAPSLIRTAFPITLKMIDDAPANSPLSRISIVHVINFLAKISCSNSLSNFNVNVHQDIIIDLLELMKKNITGKCNTVFSKALLYLELPRNDPDYLKQVEDLVNVIQFENQSESSNQNLKRNLETFLIVLKDNFAAPHNNSSGNDDDDESSEDGA